VFDDGQVVAYELPRASAPDAVSIDLRQNIGQMYAGRGWQFQYPPANWEGQFDFVWTRGQQSEIYFVAPDAAERVMTLHAYAETPQHAEFFLNGRAIAQVELAAEWTDYRITLPAGTTVPGMNRIELNFGRDLTETVGVTTISIHRGDNEAANR
jgi:hypothetical protein